MLVNTHISSFLLIFWLRCLIADCWLIGSILTLLLWSPWSSFGTFWVNTLSRFNLIFWRRSFYWLLIVKWLSVLFLNIRFRLFSRDIPRLSSLINYWWIVSLIFFLLDFFKPLLFLYLNLSWRSFLFHSIILWRSFLLLVWRTVFNKFLIFLVRSNNLNSIFYSLNLIEKFFINWSLKNGCLLGIINFLSNFFSYRRFRFHNSSSH